MSRHYSSRSYGGYGSSRRRTGADRFGILTFFLLLISSGFLAARLLTTGVLTQKPVSYTHLDVYKRQGAFLAMVPASFSAAGSSSCAG